VKVGEKTPTQLGPLEKANLNHWTPLSDLPSYLIIWDQAISAGDNRKLHNKNCDEAPTCVFNSFQFQQAKRMSGAGRFNSLVKFRIWIVMRAGLPSTPKVVSNSYAHTHFNMLWFHKA
jgi:hypothetical protein